MTARLSLLDQQEQESPWAEERSSATMQSQNTPMDQHFNREHISPNSTSPQVPMGIYMADCQIYNQQGDHHLPALVFDPSQATSNDRSSYPPQYSQQHIDPGKLGSETGLDTPSVSVSNTTTESSQELIEMDPPNEGAGKKHIHENQPASQTPSSGELNLPPAIAVEAPADSSLEQSSTKPFPKPPISEAEARRQQEQRSETYSIRHVNWTDITGKLRKSPVLVQNQNGPCPLLALVNALVLRAAENAQPPIVKALQTREQISLGLLIEALFDELTTCLGPDEELPDIEALSRFLTMLHTGMNVNPRLTLVGRPILLPDDANLNRNRRMP